jgi:hypothetical protein
MKKAEFIRVSSSAKSNSSTGNVKSDAGNNEVGRRVNALEANWPDGMKQALNAVVEVHYTTAMLEVAG